MLALLPKDEERPQFVAIWPRLSPGEVRSEFQIFNKDKDWVGGSIGIIQKIKKWRLSRIFYLWQSNWGRIDLRPKQQAIWHIILIVIAVNSLWKHSFHNDRQKQTKLLRPASAKIFGSYIKSIEEIAHHT